MKKDRRTNIAVNPYPQPKLKETAMPHKEIAEHSILGEDFLMRWNA